MKRAFERFMQPEVRLRFAWAQLILSLIGWPISLVLTDEPSFILSLSWYAITITAWDVISTTQAHREQEAGTP